MDSTSQLGWPRRLGKPAFIATQKGTSTSTGRSPLPMRVTTLQLAAAFLRSGMSDPTACANWPASRVRGYAITSTRKKHAEEIYIATSLKSGHRSGGELSKR